MENQIVIIKADELRELISQSVSNAISQIPEKKEEEILLKRKDVAKFFSVSLVTISDWMKTGKLPFSRINSRIYFKRSEVIEVLSKKTKEKNR